MKTTKKYTVIYEEGDHRYKEEWIDTLLFGIRIKREITQKAVKALDVPANIRDIVFKMDGGQCVYCGVKTTKSQNKKTIAASKMATWAVDHIVPQVQHGTSYIFNLAVSCQKCNVTKNGRTPDEAKMPLKYGRFGRVKSPPANEAWLLSSEHCPLPEDEFYLKRYDLTARGLREWEAQDGSERDKSWESHVRSYDYREPFTSEFIRLRGKTLFRAGVTIDRKPFT